MSPPATLFAHFFHFASSLPFLHLPSFHFTSFLLFSFTSFRLLFSLSICLAFNLLFTLIIHQSQSHSGKIMMNIHKALTVNTLRRLDWTTLSMHMQLQALLLWSQFQYATVALQDQLQRLSEMNFLHWPNRSILQRKIMKSHFTKISSV